MEHYILLGKAQEIKIESECPECGGCGELLYPIPGQAKKRDVCNVCWGSGSDTNPGKNLLVGNK